MPMRHGHGMSPMRNSEGCGALSAASGLLKPSLSSSVVLPLLSHVRPCPARSGLPKREMARRLERCAGLLQRQPPLLQDHSRLSRHSREATRAQHPWMQSSSPLAPQPVVVRPQRPSSLVGKQGSSSSRRLVAVAWPKQHQ